MWLETIKVLDLLKYRMIGEAALDIHGLLTNMEMMFPQVGIHLEKKLGDFFQRTARKWGCYLYAAVCVALFLKIEPSEILSFLEQDSNLRDETIRISYEFPNAMELGIKFESMPHWIERQIDGDFRISDNPNRWKNS